MKAAIRERPEVEARPGELPAGVEVELMPGDGPVPSSALDAEFLVPPWGDPDLAGTMRKMARLQVVQVDSAGVEWILPHVPNGVALCNARGLRDTPVAEWVLATILALEKQLHEFRDEQREAVWRHRLLEELPGRRALIVGYGSIGAAVERLLRPLGIEVTRVARRERPGIHPVEALDRLLPEADIVVVLLPLTDATAGMFDAARLGRLRRGALVINAGRGPVIQTDALVEALNEGRLRAALDVTDPEPLPPEHPLWRAPGVLITPHLAGDTIEAEQRLWPFIGEQLRRLSEGRPLLNVVR